MIYPQYNLATGKIIGTTSVPVIKLKPGTGSVPFDGTFRDVVKKKVNLVTKQLEPVAVVQPTPPID